MYTLDIKIKPLSYCVNLLLHGLIIFGGQERKFKFPRRVPTPLGPETGLLPLQVRESYSFQHFEF